MNDEPRYAIEPEPDEAGRAAIAEALERLRDPEEASRSPWARAARDEVVDDGIG